MKKLMLTVVTGLALAGTVPAAAPAAATDATTDASTLASVTRCTWLTPEYPHISSFNLRQSGAVDIKTSTQGSCEASPDPVSVTATMTLEKQNFLGFWSTVTTGAPITKRIQGTPQLWRRGELFAVAPCVPGTYRGRLARFARADGGLAFLLGDDIVSPAKTLDCKPRRVSMVIDDTGSMGGVIGSVSTALDTFIRSSPEDEYTRWSLTTFKDSPTDVGSTEDREQALGWVNALTADGGDDCPEDALGGISSGLGALGSEAGTEKQMVVATDASAHGGDVDGIIATARARGVRVNVLLTGDCGLGGASTALLADDQSGPTAAAFGPEVSSQVVLRRIAEETGGKYFFIPGGSTDDFTTALNDIFASIADPGNPADREPPAVSVSVTPSVLWEPNHAMVEITPTVTATDAVDPDPVVAFEGVLVNQPDDGQGDGNTTGDVEVTSDGRIFVRAERSATEGPRVYTITFKATDRSGNTGFGSATVVVPKRK